jgi:hypothetical protein
LTCEIVFRGTASVSLHRITFNDCLWSCEGPASLTVNFMTALYEAGVTDLIDQTFVNNRPRQPPATRRAARGVITRSVFSAIGSAPALKPGRSSLSELNKHCLDHPTQPGPRLFIRIALAQPRWDRTGLIDCRKLP